MFGKAARTVLVRLALIFLVLLPAGCKSLPGLEFLSSSEPAPAVAADAGGAEAEAVKFRVGDQFAFDNPFVRWEVVSVRHFSFSNTLPPPQADLKTLGSARF